MDSLASLPDWMKIVGALLAAVVLIALNLGWLLQAKALLEGRRRQYEDARTSPSPVATREARPASADPDRPGHA